MTMTDDTPTLRSLSDILDALDHAAENEVVTVQNVLTEVGVSSFAPIILVPALILVSPLSGIFGLPTIGAIFIFLITVQKLLGRPHVWLPATLCRRKVKGIKLAKAVTWLRKPCAWVDRHTHTRLTFLVTRPANTVTLLTIMGICMLIPALELLPMVTSVFAGAMSFFAIGFLARDGVFTLLGYIQTAISVSLVWWLVTTGASITGV